MGLKKRGHDKNLFLENPAYSFRDTEPNDIDKAVAKFAIPIAIDISTNPALRREWISKGGVCIAADAGAMTMEKVRDTMKARSLTEVTGKISLKDDVIFTEDELNEMNIIGHSDSAVNSFPDIKDIKVEKRPAGVSFKTAEWATDSQAESLLDMARPDSRMVNICVISRKDESEGNALIEALRDRRPAMFSPAEYIRNRTKFATFYITSVEDMALYELAKRIAGSVDKKNMAHLIISDKFKVHKDDVVIKRLMKNPICATLVSNAQITEDGNSYVFGARLADLLDYAFKEALGKKIKKIRSNILGESLNMLPGEEAGPTALGAVRANGGAYTAAEHGTRIKGHSSYTRKQLELTKREDTINGAVAKKVDSGEAYAISLNGEKLPFDKDIPLADMKNQKMRDLKSRLDTLGINYIVLRGSKDGLTESAKDHIYSYGVTRRSVYVFEEDFNYLFSLSNGVDIIVEGAAHEKAHIDNELANLENPTVKLLSEEEVDRIVPSYNLRLAMRLKGVNVRELLNISKTKISEYLTTQFHNKSISKELFDEAIRDTYNNLEIWVTDPDIQRISPNTGIAILDAVKDAVDTGNWADIVDVFRKDVSFGTAGIREKAALTEEALRMLAKYGPGAAVLKGPNTINDIVLLIKTAGVIQYAKNNGLHKVAIGYDSRIAGERFAELIAQSFLAHSTREHKFTIYLFDEASPFPELSFAVTTKEARADLGILISASHNPSNYNGYKITNYTGAQLTGVMRDAIVETIKGVGPKDIKLKSLEESEDGQLIWLGGKERLQNKDYKDGKYRRQLIDMHTLHVEQVKKFIIDKEVVRQNASKVKIGYSAFNGAGNRAVPRLLRELGFTDTKVIASLQKMDGMFPAFGWGEQPDPGDPISGDIAVREFIKEHGQKAFDELDILIGTDPDADRAGITVKVPEDQQKYFGKYKLLSANDAWTLLLWYRMQRLAELNGGTMPDADKKFITFSHVTTDALEKVGELFGVRSLGEMRNKKGEEAGNYLNGRRSWVGFSLIAEFCQKASEEGLTNLGGAEESNGFSILGGPVRKGEILADDGHVNDKDGTFAALLLAEVAAYAKSKNTSLFELLDKIYLNPKVGYFAGANKPMPRVGAFKGAEGVTKKINLLKKAQEWAAEANKRAGTMEPFTIAGLPVVGAIEFKTAKYDKDHYIGFPDEGVRFFFADPRLKAGDHFTNSYNYITIRPSGTSQTIRFYTERFGIGINSQNLGDVKYQTARRAEAIALQAQVELLAATGYNDDIANVETQLKGSGFNPVTVVQFIQGKVRIDLPVIKSTFTPEQTAKAIWSQDSSIWEGFPHNAGKNQVVNWMGWLHAPEMFIPQIGAVNDFADKVPYGNIVVLGTGGSGRAARTLAAVLNETRGGKTRKNIIVSYTPQGEEVRDILSKLDRNGGLNNTLFVVASKSGGTTETLTQELVFRAMLEELKTQGLLADAVKDHFVGITDETNKNLAAWQSRMREVFINNKKNDNTDARDIGGRFSALSLFGLVPLSSANLDVALIMNDAKAESGRISEALEKGAVEDITGFKLAEVLEGLRLEGLEHIIQIPEETTKPTGPWAEQLFNESLCKKEDAPLWVYGEPLMQSQYYSDNTVFIRLVVGNDRGVKISELNGRPLIEATFKNIGELVLNLEIAVTAWGHSMGINPFVQESVENSKNLTRAIVDELDKAKTPAEAEENLKAKEKTGQVEVVTKEGIKLYFTGKTAQIIEEKIGKGLRSVSAKEVISAFLSATKKGDYIGLFPYTNEDDVLRATFGKIRENLKTGIEVRPATLFDFGSGFHHSNNVGITCKDGATILMTFESTEDADITIPGKPYTTNQLMRAMIAGELGSLQSGVNKEMGEAIPIERRAMSMHLPIEYRTDPAKLIELFNTPEEMPSPALASSSPIGDEMVRMIEEREPELAQNPNYQKYVRPYIANFMETLASTGFDNRAKEDVTTVLAHDTAISLEQQEAVQLMHKLLAKYLGKSVITVRGTGAALVGAIDDNIRSLRASGKKFAVIAMTGKDTFDKYGQGADGLLAKINDVNGYMNTTFKEDAEKLPISAVLNVQDRMPLMPLYDVALRLAYNLGSEKILEGLKAVARDENNQPFTKDNLMDYLRRGYLCLRPIEPININEAIEASKAESAALRSL
ncbi:MAG: hypothetical protein WC419_05040 [Candidatus Omnitrophota bacterium]